MEIKDSKLSRVFIDKSVPVYLKPEADFPIDVPKYFIIIDGHPIRTRYANNKIACSSDDCITGISGKKHVSCDSCQHTIDCKMRCKIYMKTLNPAYVYILTIPYSSQAELSVYVKQLLASEEQLDAPDVITKITRIRDGEFSKYKFELYEKAVTDDEAKIVSTAMLYAGDKYTTPETIAVLLNGFGIPEGRAQALSKLV